MNKLSKIFFLFFSFSFIIAFTQQYNIEGKISDDQNRGIESASVSVLNSDNEIIAYTFSDENGNYSISFVTPYKKLKIKITNLDYQQAEVNIIDIKKTYDFKLNEKITTIQEVLLDGRKIKIDQDTTYIKVAPFTNKTEQTVEDILKKLPGIQVSKDGTIKAHGKNIDKLLIEGEDMFDKNYKILSKNLDSKVIDEVQIIDNFEDNPIFKKLNNSDKVALNLKLKKGLKNVWFGNVNLGSAVFPEERWKETLSLGLLKKKIKLFYFGDYNNLGEKPTDLLSTNMLDKSTFSGDRFEYSAKRVFNIPINEVELFSKTQSIFNRALLNSVSINSKIKNNLSLRGVVYYTNDKQIQNSLSVADYNLENNPFTITENNNYRDKKTLSSAEIELKYFPNEKNYITNLFIAKNNPSIYTNDLLFNGSNISQNLNLKDFTFYNHFNHTLQVSENKVLNNYLYFGRDKLQEKAQINSPFLEQYFNVPANFPVNQETKNKVTYLGYKAKLITKYNKIDLTNGLQADFNHQSLENILLTNNIFLKDYQNSLILKQLQLSSDNTIRYNFSKKIDVTASVNFQNINFEYNTKKSNIFLLNPSLYFNLKKTKIGNFSISYSEDSTLPEVSQLNTNFQLTDYRTFQKGTNTFQSLKNQNLSFLYYFYNDEKRYSINVNIFYIKSKSIINNLSELSNEFTLNSNIFTEGGESYNFNFSLVNYFRKLKLASKIETNNSWSNNLIAVNSNDFSISKNYFNSIKYSATTYLTGKINFDFGFAYNFFKSDFQEITTKNETKDAFVNINFKFSKVFLLESNNSVYNINKKNYLFSNIVVNYTPENSKFSYRVLMNNLLNENQYSAVSLNNYISNTYTVKLVLRYILLSAKYRF